MHFKSFQRNILITGPPGCGKSTIIEKVVQQMDELVSGFFTKEIREGGRRLGFTIHTLDGKRMTMAHINIHSRFQVGKYGVNLQNIDSIAVPAMRPIDTNATVIVDEIGKMECLSERFRQTMLSVLDSPNPVLGSIALKGDAFIRAIKQRPDIRLILVTQRNRDGLPQEILSCLQGPGLSCDRETKV